MPLSPSILVSQSAVSPNIVTVEDDSGGTDAAVTQRRVYVQTSTGTYLVPSGTTTDYTQWAIANASISLNILTEDTAVYIVTQWLDVGNNVLYTYNNYYCLAEYNKQFAVYLGQQQAISPGILQDTNYATNMAVFWMYIVYAENMVLIAADISNSQNLLNKATFMRQNETDFF